MTRSFSTLKCMRRKFGLRESGLYHIYFLYPFWAKSNDFGMNKRHF
ncbi:hypothetical protein LEP1GSC058_3471 [Leptospira fainei serovar Hurstbridge str. BUT 6]|uniref:Uncharacterized protein n=1 Tax=Leptospira fainei serovar Hurstbridge str. BUT 6 TaxID=1193011 RepID=S3W1Q5_9LEPT|nr:hypothetical protein LEP1GSC058_3471 [Leptospira fainei serovar Hurstbridge str. BUT 6]